ncbi:DUF58 domain-containing protein [Isoptericola chiayiensis]|uniref:DUF58 domain-containing protein n=1 Tax=Isoptericola chiayiensis TaxID=579446 RepID=A0ABP8YH18_9MICO|nr:uncharacterized protein (DUF58 family) [Isoptericola chiayiensis]
MSFGTPARSAAEDRGLRRPDEPVWRRTPHGVLGVVAGVVVLALGLLAGRADVALLGVPVVLGVLWRARSARGEDAEATATEIRLAAQDGPTRPGELGASLTLEPPRVAELVQVRVAAPGHRPVEVTVPDGHRVLDLRLATVRTGAQPTFVVDVRGYGDGGAVAEDPVRAAAPDRIVLPTAMPLGRIPLPYRLRGLTGQHTSRRLGDGDELRDVHPFVPGDRLRRIDWRTTARRSPELDELYVRRTYATAEATTMLVVDSRDDVGPDLRTWRGSGEQRVDEPTSLDLARHAAASVATAVVEAGDRVGLEDLGRRRRPVPPSGGRRQLRRLLYGLALSSPVGTPPRRLRAPQLPADAVVYLFTTALDDESARLARTWKDHGHRVVVVDTLPVVRPAYGEHLRIAWRITAMEREDRLRALVAEGVPVVPWSGAARSAAPARLETLVRAAERHHSVPVRLTSGGTR